MSFWKILRRSDRRWQSRDSSSTSVADLDAALPPAESSNTFNRDEVERYGISIVAQPETGVSCDVDIVCIHGVNGHPYDTWVSERGGFFWPSSITRDIPNSRVMTFGCDYNPMDDHFRLRDLAGNLLQALSRERRGPDATHRPVLFIAHNVGGFLVQQAIVLAESQDPIGLLGTGESTAGILFMGTPQSGVELTSIDDIVRRISVATDRYRCSPVGQTTGNFQCLCSCFAQLLAERRSCGSPLRVQTFAEEKETSWHGILVPRSSVSHDGTFLTESFPTNHIVSHTFSMNSSLLLTISRD